MESQEKERIKRNQTAYRSLERKQRAYDALIVALERDGYVKGSFRTKRRATEIDHVIDMIEAGTLTITFEKI